MNKWRELTVEVNREAEEVISNLLVELGSHGVMIDDSMDYLDQDNSFGEIFPQVEQRELIRLTAYYPETSDFVDIRQKLDERLKAMADSGFDLGPVKLSSQELVEEDWAENWKKYYNPTRISRELTIVPSWTDYEAGPSEKIIRLDPGMAFGTGTHSTTRMSLYALEQLLRGGETVIDVGTGSGVLSIASSLLGAEQVYAYDLDQVAVKAAQANVSLNPQAANVEVSVGNLLQGVGHEADLIVANILADILVELTEDAYRLLKDEGYLIMSGIIAQKWELVAKAAQDAGFSLERQMIEGEWHTAIFKKTNKQSGVVGG